MSKETTEFVFEKMEQYFDAAKTVIEQYGGDVAELGLGALRVQAASELAPALAGILILIAIYCLRGKIKYEAEVNRSGGGAVAIVATLMVGAASLIVTLEALLNIWAWVGIFYPELYAVYLFILK